MAILNPPNILPLLGLTAFRVLIRERDNAIRWKKLISRLAPDSATESTHGDPSQANEQGDPLNQTLRSMSELGLFTFDSGSVRLPESPADEPGDRQTDLVAYRRTLRRLIMRAGSADETWDRAPGPCDLTRSIAWHLWQDPLRPTYWPGKRDHPLLQKSATNLEDARLTQVGGGDSDGQVLHNEERWQSFVRWATFLGFALVTAPPAKASSSQRTVLLVDASAAVRESVSILPAGETAIAPFLEHLRSDLPVLPGGTISSHVASHASDPPATATAAQGQVAASFTQALLQLQDDGALQLEMKSDATSTIFETTSGSRDHPPTTTYYSHVTIN